jgi:hypothetical protein
LARFALVLECSLTSSTFGNIIKCTFAESQLVHDPLSMFVQFEVGEHLLLY